MTFDDLLMVQHISKDSKISLYLNHVACFYTVTVDKAKKKLAGNVKKRLLM